MLWIVMIFTLRHINMFNPKSGFDISRKVVMCGFKVRNLNFGSHFGLEEPLSTSVVSGHVCSDKSFDNRTIFQNHDWSHSLTDPNCSSLAIIKLIWHFQIFFCRYSPHVNVSSDFIFIFSMVYV